MIPVDAHVHFHRAEYVAPTLEAALHNFARVRGRRAGFGGALLLTQAAHERVFEWLSERERLGDWRIGRVDAEPQSLRLQRGDESVLVVCGRQVRGERGLEVLALGTVHDFEEGRPLAETLANVRASGALAVLPWGFGKWLGHRGVQVRRLLEEHRPGEFFLGDNGGRLRWAPQPALLVEGMRRGFRLLPGSDPFPFGGDYRRVGGFGCLLRRPSLRQPTWEELSASLQDRDQPLETFGRSTGLGRFGFNQLGIQLHTRLYGRAES